MSGSSTKSWFLSILLILFILCLSFISIVFDLSGPLFIVELLLVILFLILSIILVGALYSGSPWVWSVAIVFFSANLINLLGLYFRLGMGEIILPTVLSCLGFVLTAAKIPSKNYSTFTPEESFAEEYVEPIVEKKVKKAAERSATVAKKGKASKKTTKKKAVKNKPTLKRKGAKKKR